MNRPIRPFGLHEQASLVLVHGGMAQNVGPVLEMVTEKYLLRERAEWAARAEALVNQTAKNWPARSNQTAKLACSFKPDAK